MQDKQVVCVSQLSLVDLAGSERTNRTKNTGQRLREAGEMTRAHFTCRICEISEIYENFHKQI